MFTIKELCKTKGKTLSELAAYIGRSKQYMSDLSAGKINPYYEIVIKIAEFLEMEPAVIFMAIQYGKTVQKAS